MSNTIEYQGKKLIKKQANSLTCYGCFFRSDISCISKVEKKLNSSCFTGSDGNKTEVIFIEVKEETQTKN